MKFKNLKKKAKNAKSPSNSRTNPEYFKFSFYKIDPVKLMKLYRQILKVSVVVVFVATAAIVVLDLRENLQKKQNIDTQREVLSRDLNFWKNFIEKNNNYRDAYFQAAILEYKLGDISEARKYVEKGLILDPNSENGRRIEKLLK
jgi:tetratricopeptide (TPR) repeat protein